MVNGILPDFCCSFKFRNKKKHFICTLTYGLFLKSEDMKNLRLKTDLGLDKPDNGVAVATSVQKVSLIILAGGLCL